PVRKGLEQVGQSLPSRCSSPPPSGNQACRYGSWLPKRQGMPFRRRRQGGGVRVRGGHLALLGRRKGFWGSGLGQPEHMARGVQKLAISVQVAIRRRRREGVLRQRAVASPRGGVWVCA